ncbi:unnamed protein product [Dimorphilus gyrociliatus]|uniref:Uncharacterized protein n=1 Tax=Dimorphilus gyrociliatus TaxID=2664684 RepID=A0A7I8W1C8_9ANNE|nr:unnamed protein product [Dimorphilus gyrociliatus]
MNTTPYDKQQDRTANKRQAWKSDDIAASIISDTESPSEIAEKIAAAFDFLPILNTTTDKEYEPDSAKTSQSENLSQNSSLSSADEQTGARPSSLTSAAENRNGLHQSMDISMEPSVQSNDETRKIDESPNIEYRVIGNKTSARKPGNHANQFEQQTSTSAYEGTNEVCVETEPLKRKEFQLRPATPFRPVIIDKNHMDSTYSKDVSSPSNEVQESPINRLEFSYNDIYKKKKDLKANERATDNNNVDNNHSKNNNRSGKVSKAQVNTKKITTCRKEIKTKPDGKSDELESIKLQLDMLNKKFDIFNEFQLKFNKEISSVKVQQERQTTNKSTKQPVQELVKSKSAKSSPALSVCSNVDNSTTTTTTALSVATLCNDFLNEFNIFDGKQENFGKFLVKHRDAIRVYEFKGEERLQLLLNQVGPNIRVYLKKKRIGNKIEYDNAMKVLIDKYGNYRRLSKMYTKILAQLQPLSYLVPSTYKNLMDILTNIRDTYELTGLSDCRFIGVHIHTIVKKLLPKDLRKAWRRQKRILIDQQQNPSIKEFIEFLENIAVKNMLKVRKKCLLQCQMPC